MYNPYEFQNDLSRSQSEVGSMISGRAEQLKTMQTPGILKKAEALKKKGQALQKGAQDVQSAIELGLGAPMGPVVAQKIINPVIDKISAKFPSLGKRIEQGKGIISDIKGQVQKIGGQLTKNNPIRSIQDEIQGRVGGAQVAPEEQSGLDFMRENMGGFKVPTRVEETVSKTVGPLNSAEDMENERALFGDGETKGEDVIANATPDVAPSVSTAADVDTGIADVAVDTAVDTGLGAVAAADAWNPIGWIIGAGLAIGGITEAVGAVNDQAKATADQAMADSVKLPQQAPVNFAGSLVTPIQNSVGRTQ
tara:strand:+ start:1486 stop:2409 length:924 start_codon:yes stop_codon:yes gene_type:complete